MKLRVFVFVSLCTLSVTTVAIADAPQTMPALVGELLKLPTPADWRDQPDIGPHSGQVPADDASLDTLLAFWSPDHNSGREEWPSHRVRNRLTEYALDTPEELPSLLRYVDETPDVAKRIRDLESRQPAKKRDETVHEWLVYHDPSFRRELVALAEQTGQTLEERPSRAAINTLARVDWPAAEPLLAEFIKSPDSWLRATGWSLYHEHAKAAADKAAVIRARDALKAIADTELASDSAREMAIVTVMSDEWTGGEAWFASLFGQETVAQTVLPALPTILQEQPDRVVPSVLALISSSNSTARQNAIKCLAELSPPRAEVSRALLPWLENPQFAKDGRSAFLYSLSKVDLPEVGSRLLKAFANEKDPDRRSMLPAIQHIRPANSEVLLRAYYIASEPDEYEIVPAMLACHALSDAECSESTIRHAESRRALVVENDPPTTRSATQPADPEVVPPYVPTIPGAELGNKIAQIFSPDQSGFIASRYSAQLAAELPPSDRVVDAMIERADSLHATDPAFSDAIWGLLTCWRSDEVDRKLVVRVTDDPEKADWKVISARSRTSKMMGQLLRGRPASRGPLDGAVAALTADPQPAERILGGQDSRAQMFLLAVSRLCLRPLPLQAVARLLNGKDTDVAFVARAYLRDDLRADARAMVPKSELFKRGCDLDSSSPKELAELEKEVGHPDGPDEIYALLCSGGFGSDDQRIIRVRKGVSTLQVRRQAGDEIREARHRTLSGVEFRNYTEFITSKHVDDLLPLSQMVNDGWDYHYTHITRSQCSVIWMSNPGLGDSAGTTYHLLIRLFQRLAGTGQFEAVPTSQASQPTQ